MKDPASRDRSLHRLGVTCGLAAGAWLGAAEVPTKLVTAGFSPFLISLGMVAGVFLGRWTLPMLLKGGAYLLRDIRRKPHLIVWAVLAGFLWAVANTLTVFAIREVGLSIAFPLWNTNSIVGLIWGWMFFGELRGAGAVQWAKVAGGATAIVAGTCLLAYASTHAAGNPRAAIGVVAALGAGLLWGTMYIPYRKAYISGMNPLSFVTIFTFGELSAVLFLAITLDGGAHHLLASVYAAKPAMFWLLLGGLCWVLGDLFQQYAAKYIGIGRGIPLSNTNQLWGLAWGVLVFGEMSSAGSAERWTIVSGSLLIVSGAAAISFSEAPQEERAARRRAMESESRRYGLDLAMLEASLEGRDLEDLGKVRRSPWDWLAAVIALGVFVWAAMAERAQPITLNPLWMGILALITLAVLVAGGLTLWRRTCFS